MTWDDQLGRRVGHVEAQELAYRRRIIAVTPEERDTLLRAIEDRGIDVVIDEVAAWVRRILADPDDDGPLPPIGATLQKQWRINARALRRDGYRRFAEGARHVRELLRHDLDLRARYVSTPKDMDAPVIDATLRSDADFTAEQLAEIGDLRWPPRPRAYRRRRRPERSTFVADPVDPAQRDRDRAAYDRETREWREKKLAEERRRILEDDDV
ncbi:unannotated protein [freshwater metagenome]|uniref:Unannotated protein n=1 Tax=freshwater metagenome TaxID=449393 RepID=A0A6J7FUC0_9ZZZZ|nr:hypothetical protein [Actinomycetota bacterium]